MAPRALPRKNATPTKLASLIRQVLATPSMKQNAERTAALMRNEDGVRAAVQLVADLGVTSATKQTQP